MSTNTLRKLILSCAVAILVAWCAWDYWPNRPRAAAAASTPELLTALKRAQHDGVQAAALSPAMLEQRRAIVSAPWPTDPFYEADYVDPSSAPKEKTRAAVARAKFVLNAIVGGSAPLALIDGRIVGVGDPLAGGWRVAAIDEDTVTLNGPRGPRVLKLGN